MVEGLGNTLALAKTARNGAIPGLGVPAHIFLIGAASEGRPGDDAFGQTGSQVYNSVRRRVRSDRRVSKAS